MLGWEVVLKKTWCSVLQYNEIDTLFDRIIME